jgi:uncharacterized membrane protein HdeD (DUF308 family)
MGAFPVATASRFDVSLRATGGGMTNLRRETRRLALGFVVSGSVTFALGVLALALPESTLIASMLAVGLISVLFGLNQILSAAAIRLRAPLWRLVLAHGVLTLAFGLLTVGATRLSLSTAAGLIAAWLVVRSILAVRILVRAQPAKRIRYALTASAVIDGLGALLVVAIPAFTIFQYLFFGAVYAVVFGASQLAGGISLRGSRLDHVHALAAD